MTREDVEAMRTMEGAHRISFATTHADQPKRTDRIGVDYVGSFSVPFRETILPLFEADTKLHLFRSASGQGYWRSIWSEEEFARIATWVAAQGTRIFLRDCLDLSMALDQNLTDNVSGRYTELGSLEARAKTNCDQSAITALTERLGEAISFMPYYCEARVIAAVPPVPGKPFDVPSLLAAHIARQNPGLLDVTPQFRFGAPKGTVKAAQVEEKWAAWERAGLTMASSLTGTPAVILIDDKYQSGITLQYVASRLQSAGAGRVFGLCAVKTLRDTDNR